MLLERNDEGEGVVEVGLSVVEVTHRLGWTGMALIAIQQGDRESAREQYLFLEPQVGGQLRQNVCQQQRLKSPLKPSQP